MNLTVHLNRQISETDHGRISVTKDEAQRTRDWLSSIRDTAKSGMGCIGNRCLSDLAETDAVNVGGSSRNAKSSSPTMCVKSVGATIVV